MLTGFSVSEGFKATVTSNGRDSCSPLAVGAAAGEAAISRGISWVDLDFLFSGIW